MSTASSSKSDTVSDDEGEIPLESRARFSEALEKIRRRDESIYDRKSIFFESSSSSSEEEAQAQKQSPLYLKDINAQHLLRFGADAYSSDGELEELSEAEAGEGTGKERQRRLMYNEEQQERRGALLQALDGEVESEEERDFGGLERAEGESEACFPDPGKEKAREVAQKNLESYFLHVSDLKAEDAAFLKEYIEKEEWRVDKWGADEDVEEVDLEQDEAYLDAQAKFEVDYCHRFEEPGSQQVTGHPRAVDGTVRRKESKRKRQRANKAERKRQQKLEEEREIREEKNKKRREIQKKLSELNEVCGGDVDGDLLQKLLDSDNEFDAGDWDAKMEEAFNQEYYQKEDAQFQPPAEERKLDPEATSIDKRFERQEVDKSEPVIMGGGSSRAELEKHMTQYFAIDREETIEGIRCRYRYIKVPKESYGLEPHDILCLDDKQLNEYVGLRRLNPYRDDLADYKYPPWKLRQLLGQINYERPQFSEKKPEEQGTTGSLVVDTGEEDEAYLAKKIQEEEDPNVRARLEAYSRQTLKPFKARKRERQLSAGQKASSKKEKASGKDEHNMELEGLPKAQRKNVLRRKKKQEKRNNES